MEHFQSKNERLKLLKFVKAGEFQSIATKNYVVTGLIIPRHAKDSILKLLNSKFRGKLCVVWKDYLGGEECYRPLDSGITPSYLISHPGMKVRIHIMDCCGVSQGFFEPELFFGFIPDWEDRL